MEYAVRMQDFDEQQELVFLIDHHDVHKAEIEAFAATIANFHLNLRADCMVLTHPHTENLHSAVMANLATLLARLPDPDQCPDLNRVIDFTHDTYHALHAQLLQREDDGFIRECHGDLHARNIIRYHGILVPFDCIEFDPDLRWIDVMNDTAFLTMDLQSRDRADLAHAFLNRYLEITGDYAGVRLLPFYSVYRALVRAKVDAMLDDSTCPADPTTRARLRARLQTAARLVDRPTPTLVVFHGCLWLLKILAQRASDGDRSRHPAPLRHRTTAIEKPRCATGGAARGTGPV